VSRNIQTDGLGNEIQVVNTAYGARAFSPNNNDFYYVFQEADFHAYKGATTLNDDLTTSGLLNPAAHPGILQTSPQTTMSTTSVTSGVSYTISGSIGFNAAQGFNASVSAGVSITNSTTTTYPPITVQNRTDLTTGAPEFVYDVRDPSQAANSTLSYYNHWIWEIPFKNPNDYAPGQTSIEFETVSALTYSFRRELKVFLDSCVPTPFGDTFELQPPTVASVSTDIVGAGQNFKITGSGLYPSLVTGVLIGGQPLPAANFTVVNDKEIIVTAPATPGKDQPVVVRSTQGASKSNVTITIS